ncbi:MAG: energy-coupling factor transporter transmembrane component T [Mycoplasma sp.]
MIKISNSSVTNTSIFRKINPSFKLIIFILSIFMIFIPAGFFGQLIVLAFVAIQLILAKFSKRTYWNILKTFVTILAIFLLVNWISIKMPMAVYMGGDKFTGIGSWLNIESLMWDKSGMYDNNIHISNLFGGEVVGYIKPEHITYYATANTKIVNSWIKTIDTDQLAVALAKIKEYNPLFTDAEAKSMLYLLNNSYEFDGIKYGTMIIQNIPSEWMSKNLLCNQMGGVVYKSTVASFGPLGITKAIQISIKVTMIIISSTILTTTTTPSELTNGIEKIFSPLKIFRFPASECALILSIGIRFIPSLLSESKKILNAQAARGLDYYNGNIADKIKALVSLIIPLFSISIRKSDELAFAMDARAYNPRATRTQYRKQTVSSIDYVYLFISFFVLALTIFIQVYKFVLLPFGLIEAAMVL